MRTIVQGLRDAIDARIRASVTGDAGAIASALITGKRDAIYAAGQRRHVHLKPRACAVDLGLSHGGGGGRRVLRGPRAARALARAGAAPRRSRNGPALAALLAAFFYLLLSGAEVATQRAFIMTAIVLLGVMVDRAALTLRNLAIAALLCC